MDGRYIEQRKKIVEFGKRLHEQGYVVSNDGNISVLCSKDEILITPSGVSKGMMKADMMVRIDLDGKVQEGRCTPSIETPMHLQAYRSGAAVRAVIHAHPYHATLCSILGIPLEMPVLAETVIGIGMIPIAPFSIPGRDALAQSIAPFVGPYKGCLLANHGVITWASGIEKAFYQMEQIEFFARITLGILSQSRGPNLLSNEQIQRLLDIRRRIEGRGQVRVPLGGVKETNEEMILPKGVDVEL